MSQNWSRCGCCCWCYYCYGVVVVGVVVVVGGGGGVVVAVVVVGVVGVVATIMLRQLPFIDIGVRSNSSGILQPPKSVHYHFR